MIYPVLNSKRLRLIADIVEESYSHYWDCCCDHGFLGIELLKRELSVIHFVDCEDALIHALHSKLVALDIEADRWKVHCADVSQLLIPGQRKQLIIIAGVGGETCLEMVISLLTRYPRHHLDFILCPVRQMELLRSSLSEYPVGLVRDELVEERGRYYEVLHLRQNALRPLGKIAQDFWLTDYPPHKQYLKGRISYLNQISSAAKPCYEEALESYRELLIRLDL